MGWPCWGKQPLCLERAVATKERHPGSVQPASCACVCDPVTCARLLLPSDSFRLLRGKITTFKCWHSFTQTVWKRAEWQGVNFCLFSSPHFPSPSPPSAFTETGGQYIVFEFLSSAVPPASASPLAQVHHRSQLG